MVEVIVTAFYIDPESNVPKTYTEIYGSDLKKRYNCGNVGNVGYNQEGLINKLGKDLNYIPNGIHQIVDYFRTYNK